MIWSARLLCPFVVIILLFVLFTIPFSPRVPATAQVGSEVFVQPGTTDDRLGMAFISSAEIAQATSGTIPSYRYDRARSAGARWNRWPMYWSGIETSLTNPPSYNYAYQDAAVNSDVAKELEINAILMNTPGWAATALATTVEGAPEPRVGEGPRYMAPVNPAIAPTSVSPASTTPRNLYSPVFADNTDTPGPGKSINQSNYWARFVFDTISRYKGKVKVWEMWNEPDHPLFWTGTVQDYYRLLKVGYLAAKQADPTSTVLMGGMAYYSNTNFFTQLLALIRSDPTAPANNYYFDATAWHWYSRSSQMYDMVNFTQSTLARYGLGNKPIWVNETGVPIWDDPQNPPPHGNSPYFASATQDEAASYVIQAIAYGLAANVQRIFHFQEYDDGNGETFGLMRNDNSTRPSFTAYQVASQYLSNYALVQRMTDGNVEKIVFWGTPRGKVTVIWNSSPTGLSYLLAASPGATRAYRVDKAGVVTNLALSSTYSIWLPPATDNNGLSNTDYIIGGSPYLIVEEVPYTPPSYPYKLNFPLVYKNGQGN